MLPDVGDLAPDKALKRGHAKAAFTQSALHILTGVRSVPINLLQVLPPVKVQNKGQNLYPYLRQSDIKVSPAIHACNIHGLFTLQGHLMPELKHIFICVCGLFSR